MSELEVSKEASAVFRTGPFMKLEDFQNFYLEAMSAGASETDSVIVMSDEHGRPAFKVDIPCEISYSTTKPVVTSSFADFVREYGAATVSILCAIAYIAIVFIMYA